MLHGVVAALSGLLGPGFGRNRAVLDFDMLVLGLRFLVRGLVGCLFPRLGLLPKLDLPGLDHIDACAADQLFAGRVGQRKRYVASFQHLLPRRPSRVPFKGRLDLACHESLPPGPEPDYGSAGWPIAKEAAVR